MALRLDAVGVKAAWKRLKASRALVWALMVLEYRSASWVPVSMLWAMVGPRFSEAWVSSELMVCTSAGLRDWNSGTVELMKSCTWSVVAVWVIWPPAPR